MLAFYGSICVSDIDKSLIKKVMCKDGVERLYLNISVHERKEVGKSGDTHFISCSPKKEEREEGKNYIIGNLKPYEPKSAPVTPEMVASAPAVSEEEYEDLPF